MNNEKCILNMCEFNFNNFNDLNLHILNTYHYFRKLFDIFISYFKLNIASENRRHLP